MTGGENLFLALIVPFLIANAVGGALGLSVILPGEVKAFVYAVLGFTIGSSHIALIDTASREPVRIIELPETTQRTSGPPVGAQSIAGSAPSIIVSALVFAPDDRTIAVGYVDGRVRLVSLNPQ